MFVLAHTLVTVEDKTYLRDLKVRCNAVGSQLGQHNTRLICPAKCLSLVQQDASCPGVYVCFGGLQLDNFFLVTNIGAWRRWGEESVEN